MISLKDSIKKSVNNVWVAIKDTKKIQNPTKTGMIPQTAYRVVTLETFNKLKKGVKYRINKDTQKVEEYADKNPHTVVELGRSPDKKTAQGYLPNKKK